MASFGAVWRKRPVFVDFEVARLVRSGLPDETHIDATAGVAFTPNWRLFLQSYNGRADASPVAPEWSKLEASVLRRLGRGSRLGEAFNF